MSTALIPLSPSADKVTLYAHGARFCSKSITRPEWKAMWSDLRLWNGSLNWLLGDWLNFGRSEYGEKYAEAIERTDLEYQQLATAAWVSAAVPFSRRNEKLSWTHHREVAPLGAAEQGAWLRRAVAEEWSVSALRRAIRADQAEVEESPRSPGFVPRSWVDQGLRYFRRESVTGWAPARRAALKAELEPLAQLWESL